MNTRAAISWENMYDFTSRQTRTQVEHGGICDQIIKERNENLTTSTVKNSVGAVWAFSAHLHEPLQAAAQTTACHCTAGLDGPVTSPEGLVLHPYAVNNWIWRNMLELTSDWWLTFNSSVVAMSLEGSAPAKSCLFAKTRTLAPASFCRNKIFIY